MIVDKTIRLRQGELSKREARKLFTKLRFFDGDRNEVTPWRILKNGIELPRGAWAHLPDHVIFEDRRVQPERRSKMTLRSNVVLDYQGPDKSYQGQREALKAILDEEQGLVIAQPGWGKTQVALAFICEINTPTLVLVHTEDIFNQWVKYARDAIPGVRVGTARGDRWTVGDITVAMVQSIRNDMPRFRRTFAEKFGAVIVDEAHHSPAMTWETILNACPARYRVGFTATESRADGMQKLMQSLIGPVIFKEPFKSKVPVRVVPLKTQFQYEYRGSYDWQPLQNALAVDEDRNAMIAKTVVRQLRKGQSVLVLSRRIKHIEQMREHIAFEFDFDEGELQGVQILTGKTPRPKREKLVESFRSGDVRCVLTTQLGDEALDVPILSRVFLTWPGKHDGRIIQQVGRGLREHADKTNAVIFDVVDHRVGVLNRQWRQRKRTYEKIHIKVKKTEQKEVAHGSKATERRLVADRIRRRFGGRSSGR